MNVLETTEATIVSFVDEPINEAGTEIPHTTMANKGFAWLTIGQNFDSRCWLDERLVLGTVDDKVYLVDIQKSVFDKDFSLLLGQAKELSTHEDLYIHPTRCQCVDNEDGRQFEAIRIVFSNEYYKLLDVLVY